jgi:hypothetical protein
MRQCSPLQWVWAASSFGRSLDKHTALGGGGGIPGLPPEQTLGWAAPLSAFWWFQSCWFRRFWFWITGAVFTPPASGYAGLGLLLVAPGRFRSASGGPGSAPFGQSLPFWCPATLKDIDVRKCVGLHRLPLDWDQSLFA